MTETAKKKPIGIKALLECGVHFGHQKKRWNPKMKKYIYMQRGGVHIIDLIQTLECMKKGFGFIADLVNQGKTVLFVGTKKQAREIIEREARRCGMPFVNARWLGGTFSNFSTIQKSIDRLDRLEKRKASEEYEKLTKKERVLLEKQLDKLLLNLQGLRALKRLPDVVFVVDTNRDYIAVDEAVRMGIPIVALVDSNSDPEKITYPIPSNDDAIKALNLIISALADCILESKPKGQVVIPVIPQSKPLEEVVVESKILEELVEQQDSGEEPIV